MDAELGRSEDISPLVIPQLNFHNCLNVLLHPELEHHDYIAQKVCEYVGRSMLELLLSPAGSILA